MLMCPSPDRMREEGERVQISLPLLHKYTVLTTYVLADRRFLVISTPITGEPPVDKSHAPPRHPNQLRCGFYCSTILEGLKVVWSVRAVSVGEHQASYTTAIIASGFSG